MLIKQRSTNHPSFILILSSVHIPFIISGQRMSEEVELEIITDDPEVAEFASICKRGFGALRSKEFKCLMPLPYIDVADRIRNLEVKPDDIWVITFPKCGTTWTQEIVWLLGNSFDFKKAREVEQEMRFPFLELSGIIGREFIWDTVEVVENAPSPRFIKSHLPPDLLPNQLFTVKPKIIYVCRNPKDVAISYFHHYRLFFGFQGTQDEFIDFFLEDKVYCCPYLPQVLYFWEKREELDLIFLTYEEMKKDIDGVTQRMAEYLGVEITEDVKDKFLDHISFESMRNNEKVNKQEITLHINGHNPGLHFIRQGEAGAWSKVLTEEQALKFDEKTRQALEGTDFPYYRDGF